MAKKSGGGGVHGTLFVGLLGLAVGYLASPLIARYSPIKPLVH